MRRRPRACGVLMKMALAEAATCGNEERQIGEGRRKIE
jgi:hypothetical protein